VPAQKLVDTELAGRDVAAGEVRNDQCQVSALRDHRVRLIGPALRVMARMGVHIGHHRYAGRLAVIPDGVHAGGVEYDHSLKSIGVDNVVGNEAADVAPALSYGPE